VGLRHIIVHPGTPVHHTAPIYYVQNPSHADDKLIQIKKS